MNRILSLEARARMIADASSSGRVTVTRIRDAIYNEALKQLREVASNPGFYTPVTGDDEINHYQEERI